MGISCCAMLILGQNYIRELQLFFFFLTFYIILFPFFFLCVCHSDSPFLGCLFNLR